MNERNDNFHKLFANEINFFNNTDKYLTAA